LEEIVRDVKASSWVRTEAAKTLGRLGPKAAAAVPELAAVLVKMRPDELSTLQESIARSLGEIGHPATPALPALAKASGRNIDIDRTIAISIRQIVASGDEFDLVALVAQLKSKDETIRLRAVKAIARLGPNARLAAADVYTTLADIDRDVRHAAVATIQAILPNEKPSPAIIKVYVLDLQDPDETIRLRAAKVLGRFGQAAVSAVPALEAALDDSDKDVKRAVIEALTRISPP
jgi:HEAT repeat protein